MQYIQQTVVQIIVGVKRANHDVNLTHHPCAVMRRPWHGAPAAQERSQVVPTPLVRGGFAAPVPGDAVIARDRSPEDGTALAWLAERYRGSGICFRRRLARSDVCRYCIQVGSPTIYMIKQCKAMTSLKIENYFRQ